MSIADNFPSGSRPDYCQEEPEPVEAPAVLYVDVSPDYDVHDAWESEDEANDSPLGTIHKYERSDLATAERERLIRVAVRTAYLHAAEVVANTFPVSDAAARLKSIADDYRSAP